MDNRELWTALGMDLEKHDDFLAPVPAIFTSLFLDRPNRPKAMGYFDAVVGDVHGIRVHELYAKNCQCKRQGGRVFPKR